MAASDTSRVGPVIRDVRHRLGLTQAELATASGISLGAVRDIEQGRVTHPRVISLHRLAGVLGVSLDAVAVPGPAPAAPALRLSVLGPFAAEWANRTLLIGSPAQRALLYLLAAHPGDTVGVSSIVDAIWPGGDPFTSWRRLQSHASRLRRTIEELGPVGQDSPLIYRGFGYYLRPEAADVDLVWFRRHMRRGRSAQGDGDLPLAISCFVEALALWRGPPAADLRTLHDHPTVTALRQERVAAVTRLADIALEAGRPGEVLPHLDAAARDEPLNGAVAARLMRALADSGQQAAAFGTFARVRDALATELGLDPDPILLDALDRVLHGA
jgi:DNA-binding SARP family transcriptional activator/DNA-binding XRE family transcriptional regulator